ncbi:hypothetical protein C4556_00330 [Candidatus Parcubacteria bacterium]|nr:MAG: hypothetical protein C4556_00330 [Candidatus Parcubacteria bacterium]
MRNKIVLMCTECNFCETVSQEKELMNKIIMWNHMKNAHPRMAETITRMYKTVPNKLYNVRPA